MASLPFVLAALSTVSSLTTGSPKLLASRAHDPQTTILSRTMPPSSVVTRYRFRLIKLSQRRQTNFMADLLAVERERAFERANKSISIGNVENRVAKYRSDRKTQGKIL
jgi:hypothetical protein